MFVENLKAFLLIYWNIKLINIRAVSDQVIYIKTIVQLVKTKAEKFSDRSQNQSISTFIKDCWSFIVVSCFFRYFTATILPSCSAKIQTVSSLKVRVFVFAVSFLLYLWVLYLFLAYEFTLFMVASIIRVLFVVAYAIFVWFGRNLLKYIEVIMCKISVYWQLLHVLSFTIATNLFIVQTIHRILSDETSQNGRVSDKSYFACCFPTEDRTVLSPNSWVGPVWFWVLAFQKYT